MLLLQSLLALSLAIAEPAPPDAPPPTAPPQAVTPPGPADDDEPPIYSEVPDRWRVLGWGGAGFLVQTTGETAPLAGLEVAYAFEFMDIGLMTQAYHMTDLGKKMLVPGALLRVEERFETHRGLDAALSFGLGAAKALQWRLWYHIAVGLQLRQGPLIIGAEVGFEQFEILRLAGCLGFAF